MSQEESTLSLMPASWTTTDESTVITTGLTVIDEQTNVTAQTVLSTTTQISECETFRADYGIISGCVCTLALVFGVIFCFFGYRLFKGTMFTTGFIFGSSVVYFVCVEENVLPLGGKIGLSVGAGLLCGLTAVFIYYFGLFVIGFNFGFLLAVAGLIVVEQFYHPFTKWIPIGVILGIAVIGALMTLYWQKGLMMVGTGMLGAALILVGVDYFLNSTRVSEYTHDRLTARQSTVVLCLYGWLIVGLWPAVAVAGVIVQWRVTGAKCDHKRHFSSPVSGKRGKGSTQVPCTDDDSESQDDHYRHLYRIRRVNGDIISRNYMQTVQQQMSQSTSRLNQPMPEDTTIAMLTPITDIES